MDFEQFCFFRFYLFPYLYFKYQNIYSIQVLKYRKQYLNIILFYFYFESLSVQFRVLFLLS